MKERQEDYGLSKYTSYTGAYICSNTKQDGTNDFIFSFRSNIRDNKVKTSVSSLCLVIFLSNDFSDIFYKSDMRRNWIDVIEKCTNSYCFKSKRVSICNITLGLKELVHVSLRINITISTTIFIFYLYT